jgi:hypothetical protein
VWIGRTGGPIRQAPVNANGIVYASSTDGKLYAFPESCAAGAQLCEPLLEEPVGSLPPAVAVWDSRAIYAISADGVLRAFTVDGTGM